MIIIDVITLHLTYIATYESIRTHNEFNRSKHNHPNNKPQLILYFSLLFC